MTRYSLYLVLIACVQRVYGDCVNVDMHMPTCSNVEDLFWGDETWSSLDLIGSGPHERIRHSDTLSLVGVEKLYIQNAVNAIDADAFRRLPLLSTLILEGNHLEVLDYGFIGNTRIRKVYMSDNKIKRVNLPFWNLHNLEEFGMENEILLSVSNGMFNFLPVERLSLKRNKILTIEPRAFSWMPKLRSLYLCGNSILTWDGTGVFGNSSGLEELYMNENVIQRITKDMLEVFIDLRKLYLGRNMIAQIDSNAFDNLWKLEELSLVYNLIVQVETRTLPRSLKRLNVSFNRLTFLKYQDLRVEEISVVGNPLQCVCWRSLKTWMIRKGVKQTECSDSGFQEGLLPKCLVYSREACVESVEHTNQIANEFFGLLHEYYPLPDCLFPSLNTFPDLYYNNSNF